MITDRGPVHGSTKYSRPGPHGGPAVREWPEDGFEKVEHLRDVKFPDGPFGTVRAQSELDRAICAPRRAWSRMFVIRLTGSVTLKLEGYEK